MNWIANSTETQPLPVESAPWAARIVLRALQRLQHGCLTLHLPNGSVATVGDSHGPHLMMELHNWRPFAAALKSGDIGLAESYMAGDWSSHQPEALLKLFLANREPLNQLIYGTWLGRFFYRLRHLARRNTRANSRKNIHAHYDLGNSFYQLWLDETMNYSSALFQGENHGNLAQGQRAKVLRALEMTAIQPGQRLLEIGCGWGAVAELASVELGARVTGISLSTEQLDWARQRMENKAVADQVDLRFQDYRDVDDGPYDAICSIEMMEAVGQEYWPQYFASIARLLKPGGKACIQTIIIRDPLFPQYIRSTDFIQQYIFPGGCLPCPSEFRRQAAHQGLEVLDEFAFGADYAQTCQMWRTSFMAQLEEIRLLGFDDRFIRTWEFYLAYCEAGFGSGDIDVVQYTLRRPG